MNKKLGVILLFIGAYITLIAGLVWVMHFSTPEQQALCKPYDWVYGLGIAILLVIGSVLSAKGYITGFIGIGISAVGIVLDFVLLAYGLREKFLSVPLLIGTIVSIIGIVITIIFHLIDMKRIAKYGNSLMK